MTPIQKLNSFFIHKKQFEGEFASFGFSFNDTLKQEIKDLKKNNEFDRELIKKYIFIQSEIYFYKSIQQILRELEQEVNDKVNVVGQNDLKSEFIYSNIQNLHNLLDKIEVIFNEYPQPNINKSIEKAELFFHYVGIKDKEPEDIRTSDDILNDIVSIGNEIQPVPKDIILKLYDFEYSDVYIGFLIKTSTVIINSIKQIISENKEILIEKYDILNKRPFLISKKLLQVSNKKISNNNLPKTFNELFHDGNLVNPCIDILKELTPPFIDTDYNFIGTLKGIYCIWIDELTNQGIMKRYTDRKIYASLIPTKIKGFSIDESMFGKIHKKAENHRIDIKTRMSMIKLSQVSQKEN